MQDHGKSCFFKEIPIEEVGPHGPIGKADKSYPGMLFFSLNKCFQQFLNVPNIFLPYSYIQQHISNFRRQIREAKKKQQLLRMEQHHLKFRIATFHDEKIVREGYLHFPIVCVLSKDVDKIT